MKAIYDPLEKALDAALEMTFPASDPIAVYMDDVDSNESAVAETAAH